MDKSGALAGLVGIMIDVTDQKKAEEERLRLSKLESLGLLAGGIAHDFNNIFTVILGNIGLVMLDSKITSFGNPAGANAATSTLISGPLSA